MQKPWRNHLTSLTHGNFTKNAWFGFCLYIILEQYWFWLPGNSGTVFQDSFNIVSIIYNKSVCLSISNLILLIIFYFSAWPTYTSNIWIATGLSVLAINTWVLPFKHLGPNGPSWTICTLFFWYWCFPLILPRVQRLTNKQLAHGIVHYFWLNIAVSILIVAGLGAYFGREVNF